MPSKAIISSRAAIPALVAATLLGGLASPAVGAPVFTVQKLAVVTVAADSFDAICKRNPRNHILKRYYRGPAVYSLRCGTTTWGWKHIKTRHGWNATMDKRIGAAFWSGQPNGRGGFSTYTATCPSKEKFRTIIGTPAGTNDLLTAYTVNATALAAAC